MSGMIAAMEVAEYVQGEYLPLLLAFTDENDVPLPMAGDRVLWELIVDDQVILRKSNEFAAQIAPTNPGGGRWTVLLTPADFPTIDRQRTALARVKRILAADVTAGRDRPLVVGEGPLLLRPSPVPLG